MALMILHPGTLTTVQDLGRPGYRHAGVCVGGAVDAVALRLANLAVGNDESAAGLECTLVGPRLRFEDDAVIAVGGASVAGIESWRPTRVRRGDLLSLQRIVSGCRAFLAVAGGIDVPIVLGGRGTDLRSGFGGLQGRALRRGDVLHVGAARRGPSPDCRINADAVIQYSSAIRVVAAEHADEFETTLEAAHFTVSPKCDRMGARLSGTVIARKNDRELLSFAVAPGSIQVPPDGQPIILLSDAQTIGGYPVIAHVITADLPLAAQLAPGQAIRFRRVSLEEAHAASRAREQAIAIIRARLRAMS